MMNNLRIDAKKEYYLIKALELTVSVLVLTLTIYFLSQFFQSGPLQITSVLKSTSFTYYIIILVIGTFTGVLVWRSYRIPTSIQTSLISYYNNLGYTTKKTLFHILKIRISSQVYFTVKVVLYDRASSETCLFRIESMYLPIGTQEGRFKEIGAQYLLKTDLNKRKFTTYSELEEVHNRSLFLIQAVENFLKLS